MAGPDGPLRTPRNSTGHPKIKTDNHIMQEYFDYKKKGDKK